MIDENVIRKVIREEIGRAQMPKLLSPAEAAMVLGLTPKTLSNLRSESRGPDYVKIGGAVRYEPETLQRYIESRRVKP